jgi:hypothetical protein
VADEAFGCPCFKTDAKFLVAALIAPAINFSAMFMDPCLALGTLDNGVGPLEVAAETSLTVSV